MAHKLSIYGNLIPKIQSRLNDFEMACEIHPEFSFIVWHAVDSFELRFASLTSAILTELTNGVCTYSHDIWYINENLVENAWKEIKEYETSLLKEKDLRFHEFEKW